MENENKTIYKLEKIIDDLTERNIRLNEIIGAYQEALKIDGGIEKMNIMLDDGAFMPERAHDEDAGYDLRSRESKCIYHGACAMFDTGVHFEIPKGYVGLLTSKSGLMAKGITSRGTIDPGYTGSIKIVLQNDGEDYTVNVGDKISQIVFFRTETPKLNVVSEIKAKTGRGNKGFGSTGR